jgi:hypothetical protein
MLPREFEPLPLRVERRWLLLALALVHVVVYLQFSVLWFAGSGPGFSSILPFVMLREWWSCALSFLVATQFVWFLFVRVKGPWWLSIPLSLAIDLAATGLAATGLTDTPFVWGNKKGMHFHFGAHTSECTLIGAVWWELGWALLAGTVARTLLLQAHNRSSAQRAGDSGRARRALGLAGVSLSLLLWAEGVPCHLSPRYVWGGGPTGAVLLLPTCAVLLGLLLLASGIAFQLRRARWLREVAAGKVQGAALRPATPDDQQLPVFHRELLAPPAQVLVVTAGSQQRILGLTPDVSL